jgi:hypothetical protein
VIASGFLPGTPEITRSWLLAWRAGIVHFESGAEKRWGLA